MNFTNFIHRSHKFSIYESNPNDSFYNGGTLRRSPLPFVYDRDTLSIILIIDLLIYYLFN